MTNPLVFHLASAVEDKQDALLNTWIIAWVGHALVTNPVHLFDTNIFYPYTNTLAFSETLLPQGLLALPVNLAADNTVLGYNFVLLFSLFLAGYGMYLLVLDLTRHRGAALVAGAIFAFNPFNLGNLAQVQLLSFGWLPLALLYFRRMLADQDKLPARHLGNCFLFALFFSIQSLASIYYAFLSGAAVALYSLWHLVTRRPGLTALTRAVASLTLSGFIIVILVVPILLPYLQVQKELGFQRKVEESEPFSASLKLYTEVSPQNIVYGNLLAPRPPVMVGGYALDNLFPGIAAVALAILGLAAGKQRDRWFYLLLLLFAFVLSLGPRLFIAPSFGTEITLPYRWLYDAVALTHALRAPVRFDALVMFALAVLAGIGLSRWQPRRWVWAVALGLVTVEYLAFPAANITPVPSGDDIPQYVRWLAKQPHGTILELPMLASDPTRPLDLTTQYLSTYHWQNTVDGYSGFIPGKRGEIAYELQTWPDARAIALLQALDMEYVVVHSNSTPVATSLLESRDLQVAAQFGGDIIYRLKYNAPQAYALSSARLYLPQPAAPNELYTIYLILDNPTRSTIAVRPTEMLQVDAVWQGVETTRWQHTTVTMPLVSTATSVIPIRLLAPPSAGTWHLELKLSLSTGAPGSVSGDVSVENGEPAHQVVLPIRVTSDGIKTSYVPGEKVEIALGFKPSSKIDQYYSVSVRLVDSQGNKIGAVDREPSPSTFLWRPDRWVQDRFTFTLPGDLKPGEYTVQMKMYQANQGIDALLVDLENKPVETIQLGKFTVK